MPTGSEVPGDDRDKLDRLLQIVMDLYGIYDNFVVKFGELEKVLTALVKRFATMERRLTLVFAAEAGQQWFGVEETALILQRSEQTVRRYVSEGRLVSRPGMAHGPHARLLISWASIGRLLNGDDNAAVV